jgi:hypothetical protein
LWASFREILIHGFLFQFSSFSFMLLSTFCHHTDVESGGWIRYILVFSQHSRH